MGRSLSESNISTLRRKIANSQVLNRLVDYIESEPDDAKDIMTPDQAKNAQLLLSKVLPTLQVQTITGQVDINVSHRELSRDQLKGRLIELHAKRLGET